MASSNRASSPPPESFSNPVRTSTAPSSLNSSKYKDKVKQLSAFSGWTLGRRPDEPRNPRQPKHSKSRRRKSKRRSVDPATIGSSQQGPNPLSTHPEYLERRSDFSDDERSTDAESVSSSSSSAASVSLGPSDEITLRLHELATILRSSDRNVLQKAIQHIQDQDREIRKAVTMIAKMHKADKHKRDDSHFINLTKTLRVLIENWSRTQKIVGPNPRLAARQGFTEIFRDTPSSSISLGTTVNIGLNHAWYLSGKNEDIAKVMQAYLWSVLMRYVFGKNQWASEPDACINLLAIVSPRAGSSGEAIQTAQYHEWRAMTARLAEQNMEIDRFTKSSEKIHHLGMKPLYLDSEKGKVPVDSMVLEIIHRALDLDLEMSKQKALFHFSYLQCPPYYDRNKMDMVNSLDRTNESTAARESWNVDMFIAPALCKFGTSDGEHYDSMQSMLLAAEVVCSPSRQQQQQQQQVYRTASSSRAPSPRSQRSSALHHSQQIGAYNVIIADPSIPRKP